MQDSIVFNFIILAAAFLVLSKSASFLVDGAVGIAFALRIPKIVIGIVLVSFGTTAPEFTVTMVAAVRGSAGIGLGNALGSVIFNGACALALAAIISKIPIPIDKRMLNTAGLVLPSVFIVTFLFSLNGILSRGEGIILLCLLAGYLAFLVVSEKRRRTGRDTPDTADETGEHVKRGPLWMQFLRFTAGLAGVITASRFMVPAAEKIALFFKVPEIIVGLTIVAIGTSLPELATCITAARKGHGDLAFGDIIGANILNIAWIIGAAASFNRIGVSGDILYFAFPSVMISVLLVLGLAWQGYSLKRWNGAVLLAFYAVYLAAMIVLYYIIGTAPPPA